MVVKLYSTIGAELWSWPHPFSHTGPDVVVWNLHRRYGHLRLPLLLTGWEEVERVGWGEELASQDAPYTNVYEPVFVLSKVVTTDRTV